MKGIINNLEGEMSFCKSKFQSVMGKTALTLGIPLNLIYCQLTQTYLLKETLENKDDN